MKNGYVKKGKNPAVCEMQEKADEFGPIAVGREHGSEQIRNVHSGQAEPLTGGKAG